LAPFPDDQATPGDPPPFRPGSVSVARIPLLEERAELYAPGLMPGVFPRDRYWLHALLLLLTFGTTTWVGISHYAGFMADFGAHRAAATLGDLARGGLWYSVTIMLILGAHEMGHYLACRYYRINATLPFFIPVPPPVLTGTLGAFIRIRQPVRSKRVLFDIGIAGPLAGFVVAVPALLIGLSMSRVAALPGDFSGSSLGEPLLFKGAAWALWGTIPEGYSLNLHPMGFAAWFGLLATALNLFPIGQLDGGHISYAVLGRRSSTVTLIAVGAAVVLTFFSLSWLFWTGLLLAMLFFVGPHHPPTLDERVPLDRARLVLALVALLVFVLSFTAAPIQPLDLVQR
jgi:membrane-associated protease RseP (regulator of RpoE activity)